MDLKELLGEELYEQVQEKIEEQDDDVKLIVNDGSFIPRDRLNSKNEEIEALKEQLEERDKQIEQLKEDSQTSDELQQKIEDLQEKNQETREELEAKLQQQQLDSEVEKSLLKAKARNPKAVKALLDFESVELDEDGVKGLNDQLEDLKENEPYLFEQEEEKSSKAGEDIRPDYDSGGGSDATQERLRKMMGLDRRK